MDLSKEKIIEQTNKWIKSVVIDCNFCPFAAKALLQKSIRYHVNENSNLEEALLSLQKEVIFLEANKEYETGFIIFPNNFSNFEDYLDLVFASEQLIVELELVGEYQIASFHPEYVFEGADANGAANYTNRSIYPMLHLLREASLEKALSLYPHPELIPENNITFAQKKGLAYMQALRLACF
jgi:hypothetical protein